MLVGVVGGQPLGVRRCQLLLIGRQEDQRGQPRRLPLALDRERGGEVDGVVAPQAVALSKGHRFQHERRGDSNPPPTLLPLGANRYG